MRIISSILEAVVEEEKYQWTRKLHPGSPLTLEKLRFKSIALSWQSWVSACTQQNENSLSGSVSVQEFVKNEPIIIFIYF